MILRECACQDMDDEESYEDEYDGSRAFVDNNGPGEESGMIKSNLYTLSKKSLALHDMIKPTDDLPEWVQEKIAVAESMIGSVFDYLDYEYQDSHSDDHDFEDDDFEEFDESELLEGYLDSDYDMSEEEFEDIDADEVMHEPWSPLRQSTGIMFFEEDDEFPPEPTA